MKALDHATYLDSGLLIIRTAVVYVCTCCVQHDMAHLLEYILTRFIMTVVIISHPQYLTFHEKQTLLFFSDLPF